MGRDDKRALISGGVTGSLFVIGAGFKLAFPDMIVPFGWALALMWAGILGLGVTSFFGICAFKFSDQRPSRDVDLAEALCYIVTGKWGVSTKELVTGKIASPLEVATRQLEQALSDGLLTAWGKPVYSLIDHFGGHTRFEPIAPEYWRLASLHWDNLLNNYASTYCVNKAHKDFVEMIEIKLSRSEVRRARRRVSLIKTHELMLSRQ